MAQKQDGGYPSPSAAQAGAGVGPYQQNHQDPAQDALDLNAQLHAGAAVAPHQHESNGNGAVNMNPGVGLASAVAQHLNNSDSYYAQPPQASSPQPYQGQIPGISGPMPAPPADDSARKKTKVTRACDECRRKKIKCDAESEAPGGARCSNCSRTNTDCKFSRAPQKRGPSKGYIKELSDRVAQLENVGRTGFEFEASPTPVNSVGDRKRTYSMAESTLYDSSILDKYRTEPPKSFGPVAVPEASMAPPPAAHSKAKDLGIELASPESFPPQILRPLHHVETQHLDLFMTKINRFFPLLGSRDGINANLQYCIPPLRQAFYYAVGSVVGTVEYTSGEQTRLQCANNVYNMMNTAAPPGPLSERMHPPESRPWQANLVYLQILLLLCLHQESSGQMHDDPFGAYTKDQLIQQARRMVDYLQLRHVTEVGNLGSSPDASRIFSSARRAYWIFVVLDIWNSLGSRSARQLPKMSVDAELSASDRSVLGDEFYHFVRRSSVPAMMSDLLKQERLQASTLTDTGYWMLAMQHSATASENNAVPSLKAAPLAAISAAVSDLFCTLLIAGAEPCPPTRQIVQAANVVAERLAEVENLPEGTPLVHHFVVVTAKVLVDANRFPPQRGVARHGLQNLVAAVRSKGLLDTSAWREPLAGAVLEALEDDKSGVTSEMELDGAVNGDSSIDLEKWKSSWPQLIWEGYLRTPV